MLALLANRELSPLVAEMDQIDLEPGAVLFEAGEPIGRVVFPLTGIVSLIVVGDDGADIEAATVGNEGVLGLGGLLANDVSFSRQVVQSAGRAVRIAREPFLAAVNTSRRVRAVLAAHADAFTGQLLQSAACNAKHDVEQRLARWLLTMADRSGQTTLTFTHGAIADMLGVQRPTVTLTARMLHTAGLVDYRRGTLTIVDRDGLAELACECYGIIRRAYDNALKAEAGAGSTKVPIAKFVARLGATRKQPLVVPLDGVVAVAGNLLQAGPVRDGDRTAGGDEDLCSLQAAYDKRHRGTTHAEGDGQIIMREVDAVSAASVECHQQPARHALLRRMLGVAGRRLQHLGREGIRVTGEETAQASRSC